MKAKFTFSLFFVLLLALTLPSGVKADPVSVYFPTLGNCYLCQLRIEAAINELQGIHDCSWNYETKITNVTYDDNIMDPFIIMDAIARVGHDTEWYPAPDSAYNALIGTCCEYERTMDYTNVQVGYLSLMDLWVFHVGYDEILPLAEISIIPSAGTGMFNITTTGIQGFSENNLSVYAMNGTLVHTTDISATETSRLDLTHLQKGQYVVVISGNGSLLARTKLIKL